MSFTLSTQFGATHEYSVTLNDGWHEWVDRQRMPFMRGPYITMPTPHLISRRAHVEYVRRAVRAMRPALDVEPFRPLAWLVEDVREGRMPRAGDKVTSTGRYLNGITADGRPLYRRVRLTATGRMVQLERLHRDYSGARRAVESLMSHDASGEGRGTIGGVERIPGAVNGTETRHSPRWKGSRQSLITTTVIERDESTGLLVERQAPVDWRCYSVAPDGTRTPFTVERTSSRKRTSKVSTIAALQAVATTAGHVEAVTSS